MTISTPPRRSLCASTRLEVESLAIDDWDEIVDVLVDAFGRYPVMRHVLGPAMTHEDLSRLIRLFVGNRLLRGPGSSSYAATTASSSWPSRRRPRREHAVRRGARARCRDLGWSR
jgi:hypothetical protein